jgi:hypothetical protein
VSLRPSALLLEVSANRHDGWGLIRPAATFSEQARPRQTKAYPALGSCGLTRARVRSYKLKTRQKDVCDTSDRAPTPDGQQEDPLHEKEPTLPERALHSNALTGSPDSTAVRPQEATSVQQAAVLISAIASLITALTGVAVLLLHNS